VGIINRIYDRDQSLLFDDLIFINDRRENICRIIKNNLIVVSSRESPNKKLSRRELDVLKLLVKGYANRQIADELFISIHTVITHRRNISRKLGIKSIAGLAIYSVINNIIDIDDYLNNIQ
jgi:DNA-binding NarL/FixJ family response regulator